MQVTIKDQDGNELGGFLTNNGSVWKDLLLYASGRWEESARSGSIVALEEILAHAAGTDPR